MDKPAKTPAKNVTTTHEQFDAICTACPWRLVRIRATLVDRQAVRDHVRRRRHEVLVLERKLISGRDG